MTINPAHLAVLQAWRKTCARIATVEQDIKIVEREKHEAQADLVRMQGAKAALEAHAAQHDWVLEPEREATRNDP